MTQLVNLFFNQIDLNCYTVTDRVSPYKQPSTCPIWPVDIREFLRGLEWNNYILAGGAVWRLFSGNLTGNFDLDFFVYGKPAVLWGGVLGNFF